MGDPTLPLGYIGIPWQFVLKLYEPFTEYQIMKNQFNVHVKDLIKEHLGLEKSINTSDLKRFLVNIIEAPNSVNPTLQDELVRIAQEIVKGKQILYKRDPVENRDSYLSAFIRVDRDSFALRINTLDCAREGADFDG